jgi:membrane-bound lytic murein transglycosylase D
LNIDSYVDDRSNPLKASAAAAQYMTNMYKIFGDWDLVLASYNSGPGNVAKAIRRSGGQQNFWNIRKYLPQETQGYVPNFIAAAYLLTYHAEHNIIPMEAKIHYIHLDTVCLRDAVHMNTISKLLDWDLNEQKIDHPSPTMALSPNFPLDYSCLHNTK